jgi:hypothetical protein
MSRSNPTPTNPAKKFFEWGGGTGTLHYYDKEKQERIEVKLPFEFLVLDELATITGFCEQDTSRYWSNEVRSVAKDEFIVKTSAGTKEAGYYRNLTDVRSKGAKYAKSIYIAYREGDGLVIGNIKAYGACLTSWIEFSRKHVVTNGKVILTGSEEAKKGATTYYTPTFAYVSASDEENEIAIELDRELQVYLSKYLSTDKPDEVQAEEEVKTISQAAREVFEEATEEIDLSEIPF